MINDKIKQKCVIDLCLIVYCELLMKYNERLEPYLFWVKE